MLCAIAIVGPFMFGTAQAETPTGASIPAGLRVDGKLTIVEMSDFECPYCRTLHPSLSEVLKAYGDRIAFVRLSVPLGSHKHARTAAIAYSCAKIQGNGERMAHLLFAAEDISEKGCVKAAGELDVDQDRFRACLSGPEGEQAMMRDVELAKKITFRGLPTLIVGNETLLGAREPDELRKTIDAQLAGDVRGVSFSKGWLWSLLGVMFALVAGVSLRTPR